MLKCITHHHVPDWGKRRYNTGYGLLTPSHEKFKKTERKHNKCLYREREIHKSNLFLLGCSSSEMHKHFYCVPYTHQKKERPRLSKMFLMFPMTQHTGLGVFESLRESLRKQYQGYPIKLARHSSLWWLRSYTTHTPSSTKLPTSKSHGKPSPSVFSSPKFTRNLTRLNPPAVSLSL